MKLTADNHATTVTLSETNLRSLLAAWEHGQDATMRRTMIEDGTGQVLIVRIEADAEHYADREPGFFGIHPSLR